MIHRCAECNQHQLVGARASRIYMYVGHERMDEYAVMVINWIGICDLHTDSR